MEDIASKKPDAALAWRINREAGFIVLTTACVFLIIFLIAALIGVLFGELASRRVLVPAFVFTIPFFPSVEIEGPPGTAITGMLKVLAAAGPYICIAIVLAWRTCVRLGDASIFTLALRTSLIASAAVIISFTLFPIVWNVVIDFQMVDLQISLTDFWSFLGNFALALVVYIFLIGWGLSLSLPAALACASFYFWVVRPFLRRRGLVDDLQALKVLPVEKVALSP